MIKHQCPNIQKRRRMKLSTLFGYGVIASAVLLSAYKGTVDYLALGLFAFVLKLPGTKTLGNILKGKSE